jgi:hypothetical protein
MAVNKQNYATLRLENLPDRITPSAFRAGDSVTVAGMRYLFQNAVSSATSLANGFSDAAMTTSQKLTTKSGGLIDGRISDAFDGALGFAVDGSPLNNHTYYDLDGICDLTNLTITCDPADRSVPTNTNFGGVTIASQFSFFTINNTTPGLAAQSSIVRAIWTIHNPTSSAITQTYRTVNNLASDADTTIFRTSSGDNVFDAVNDQWVVTFENFIGSATTSSDARILHVRRGPIATAVATDGNYADGDENPFDRWTITVPAGETRRVMMFTGLFPGRQDAADAGQFFESVFRLDAAGFFEGLSQQDKAEIVNWDLSQLRGIRLAVGADSGGGPHVRAFDAGITQRLDFFPFSDEIAAGVRVAHGDVNGDGVNDLVTALGPGDAPRVTVTDGVSGAVLFDFLAFDANFLGGVNIAVGDVNGDGFADIITGADANGGPHVRIWDGATGDDLGGFFAYSLDFHGGVRVAAADLDRDGKAEVITGAGDSGSAHIRIWNAASLTENYGYIPSPEDYRGGVYVATGDLDGDGIPEIVAGAGLRRAPVVELYSSTGTFKQSFMAYSSEFEGSVRVAVTDIDADGRLDIITGPGPGGGPHVRAFQADTFAEIHGFFAFDASFFGGIFVG